MSIPTDFPQFRVPGYEKEMTTLRELFWLHYPGAGPKSTLWDPWLPMPSLWPAVRTSGMSESMRAQWRQMLMTRPMDGEGYVSVMQHASIAHPQGWPFPFWNGGVGGYGWHFSFKDTIGEGWRPNELSTTEGWKLVGVRDNGIGEYGWSLNLTEPNASITAPPQKIDPFNAPFLQLRWKATGLKDAQPYVEWTTKDDVEFGQKRRLYFDPIESESIVYTVIPMYKHPEWKGEIAQLRINFGNPDKGDVTLQAFFTQYDTRHDINGQIYTRGCTTYFRWTRDINFLRTNINRMRTALRYTMTEHQALERKYVFNSWVGHDGRSGLRYDKNGKKEVLYGHGIGDNYWDLIPFGHKDCYATILYYEALNCMAEIETAVREHPEWNVPLGVLAFDPEMLRKHAAEVKAEGNKLFWNAKTGRFVPNVDADGNIHDYGLTFLSLEAIYYDFATPEHAKEIMSWICGERMVEGDTAKGEDIYHWRFAPRATTKRNIDYYYWGWTNPENIKFGDQIQDGGAVLGFAYHDMMARLKTRGPDNVWQRLKETIKWFGEVQAAGGYRKYYDGSREGTCQGSGTPGGLGLDMEFFESVLVPQIVMDGFLGFAPHPNGFSLNPRLPSDWPELTVDKIHFQDPILKIRATRDAIEISAEGKSDTPTSLKLPKGQWKGVYISNGKKLDSADGVFQVDWSEDLAVRFEK